MMKILIIEDESLAADRLENQLQQIDPKLQVVAKIGSVKEAVKWLMKETPDLIFLDIQLSDGLSFSIFEQVTTTAPIIFTTAYDQYAIRAFQLNSIDYLLKPIKPAALQASLQKLDSMKQTLGLDFQRLIASYQGQPVEYKQRFLIRIGDKLKKVDTSEIAYFYALEKNVFCRTFSGQNLPMDHSLDHLENLVDPACFFRINRRYLIHIESIENMIAWSRSRIKLELKPPANREKDTIVSIDRSANFRQWLEGGN